MTSLDSIIRFPLAVDTPTLIREDFPLVEFHSKCWGKDLDQFRKPLPNLVPTPVVGDKKDKGKAEEKSLDEREGQTQGLTRTESDEDGGVVDGDKKGKEKSLDEEEGPASTEDDEDGDVIDDNEVGSMEEDWSELDDITPDTCVFDIKVESVSSEPILIRADYIRMFDAVNNYFSSPRYVQRACCAIVTGQPGIGKTIWNLYAIARCLSQCRRVIWLYAGSYYLFTEGGVYELPSDFQKAFFPEIIWVFVDSDGNREGIPAHLTVHFASNLFIIYTTSPNKDRWSNIHSVMFFEEFVMNPWTRTEIHRAAKLMPMELDFELIDDIYDRLGPAPRLCIEKVIHRKLAAHEAEVRTALQKQSVETLQGVIHGAKRLELDSMSHKLYLIRRVKRDDLGALDICITPITRHIGSRLALRLRNATVEEQLKLYKLYSTTPSFRGMTRTLFEGYCHGIFQGRIRVRLHEMIRREGGTETRKPQWHTVYSVLFNKTSEKRRQDALDSGFDIDICPSDTYEYLDGELAGLTIRENVYYIPSKDNEEDLDPFILSGGYLYAFQMSGARRHGVKGDLIPLLDQCVNVPPHDLWRFVFVIPNDGQVLKTPYPKSAKVRKLRLFSAKMVTETEDMQRAKANKKPMSKRMKDGINVPDEVGEKDEGAAIKKPRRTRFTDVMQAGTSRERQKVT